MPLRVGSIIGGASAAANSRVRSTSPSTRALVLDSHRFADLLRNPPAGALAADTSTNTSICSSPNSPGDLGDSSLVTCIKSTRSPAVVVRNQLNSFAEKTNSTVARLQKQCDTDRRRLAQLERKVEARLEELASGEGDGREGLAALQGSVSGLAEETQALARRLESLDERLWTQRPAKTDLAKERKRELEMQVQALEQQSRLAAEAADEMHKRQSMKLWRNEHAIDEAARRLAKIEEEVRAKLEGHRWGSHVSERFDAVEEQQDRVHAQVHALQVQLDEGLQSIRDRAAQNEAGRHAAGPAIREAMDTSERNLAALERKVTGRVEDLASSLSSLQVKVDGQLQRLGVLAQRLETAHGPALDSLRSELEKLRSQDRRELDGEIAALRGCVREGLSARDEAVAEVREGLREVHAKMAAAASPHAAEHPAIQGLDERSKAQDRALRDLRCRVEALAEACESLSMEAVKLPENDLEDLENLRSRLERVEEQGAMSADAERADQRQAAQARSTICELVEQVNHLKQQALSGEAASTGLQKQVQHLQQAVMESQHNDDSAARWASAEVEAKVTVMSQQVADVTARLLDVEGGLEFTRTVTAPSAIEEVSAMTVVSEAGSTTAATLSQGLVPQPRGDAKRRRHRDGDPLSSSRGTPAGEGTVAALQEKLLAVADHLEAMDVFETRMSRLEQQVDQHHGILCTGDCGDADQERADLEPRLL